MSKMLKKLLEGATAIPYSDATIRVLEEATESYIDITRVYNIVEELSLCYLGGKIPSAYKQHISSYVAESSPIINLPNNVLRRTAFFIIWKIIMDTNDVEDLTRSISTTIFMNFLIIKKPNFLSIPNPEEVKSIYKYHISSLINNNDNIQSEPIDELVERIFRTEFDISDLSNANISGLRKLAEEASLYSIEKYISQMPYNNVNDEFLTAYNIVKHIVDTLKSPLTPCDIIYYLKRVLGSNVSKHKKLKNIITLLPKYSEDGVFSNSSVILRLLNNYDIPEARQLLETYFTVNEFGIYLFYELLVERLIEQNEI